MKYIIKNFYKPLRVYTGYEYTLKYLKDKFIEEKILKVDGIPQNKIVKVDTFEISELIKPLIKDNIAYYEVMWTRFKLATIETWEVLFKEVKKNDKSIRKKNKINFINKNK
jgi:hypothetical protein